MVATIKHRLEEGQSGAAREAYNRWSAQMPSAARQRRRSLPDTPPIVTTFTLVRPGACRRLRRDAPARDTGRGRSVSMLVALTHEHERVL